MLCSRFAASLHRALLLTSSIALLLLGACGDDSGGDAGLDSSVDASVDSGFDAGPPPVDIDFSGSGPVAGPSGAGSFTLGVATAAAQIEEDNDREQWWPWSMREEDGGLGKGAAFVGAASGGWARATADVALLEEMNLDAYRFSVSWGRIEPTRGNFDESAIAHYSELLDALVSAGIKPMITVHHFSFPTWVDDPARGLECPAGPTDADLCGLADPAGADATIAEAADFACLLAERYGDRVDEWATVNEPVNYLLASYGVGSFPPGRDLLVTDFDRLVDVFRNYLRMHVAIYDAIKRCDTQDADGDGANALVGFTLNTVKWVPTRRNAVSDDPEDVAAAAAVEYVYHYLFVDSILNGSFDSNLDQTADETHTDWTGKLDWLGVQYYTRTGVTSAPALIPQLGATPCFGGFDFGACLPASDETHWVPTMDYEYWEPGIYDVLTDFSERWPDLPMTVTESGLATEVGRRRAEHVVRSLEQIARARDEGVDVRGYYHWSLYDNFEWAEGFVPRFGLYRVDRATFERTATEGATTLGEIAGSRQLSATTRESYGGLGPMTPEP
ncbi:MAG: glycoside hydrolase family 1 protein [Deltaproteobacteria bacterium]|nr:glycoside hydrolase family 1 protein [Deltaproteobacteria bacterium]